MRSGRGLLHCHHDSVSLLSIIFRETENFTKPQTLKTSEEIPGASSSEESEGLISLDSMSSNLFCSGSYLESEPPSIVEFYCDDDLTIPAQWGFLTREEQVHFLDKDKTLFDYEDMFLSMSFINENDDKSLM